MDNLISRQAAIDLVRDVCDAILSGCGSHYDGEDEVYDDLLEVDAILKCNKEIGIALQNMPSAQPERIRGRWIDKDGGLATCSACGDRWGVWSVMNFCPNCGADMREDK